MPPASVPATAEAAARDVATAEANAGRVRRASALDIMASRLNIEPARLKSTLQATVFRVKDTNNVWRSCSDEEFAALIIVANEYGLNPLTKEIYAFPAKGGGIVPLVSVDGWIRIMNDHPMFDGIEFKDLVDAKDHLTAIETTIWRKDRTRPIRVTEYLDECRRDTDPWKKSPARMLRHKSLIQCNRVAFGFSGIYSEDDVVIGDIALGGDNSTPPMRTITDSAGDPPHDVETGEIKDDKPVETDARGREVDPREAIAGDILERAQKVETIEDYNALAEEVQPHIDAMSDEDMAGACNAALRAARQRVTQK